MYSFSPYLEALIKFTFSLLKVKAGRSYIFSKKKNIIRNSFESHLVDRLHEARIHKWENLLQAVAL